MFSNLYVDGVVLFLVLSVMGGLYYNGYNSGYSNCNASQVVAQNKQTEKVTKLEKKIKHEAPSDVNADDAVAWVFARATRQ